jgi:hypothetical protein
MHNPGRLKPNVYRGLNGTAKAVPLQTIDEFASNYNAESSRSPHRNYYATAGKVALKLINFHSSLARTDYRVKKKTP